MTCRPVVQLCIALALCGAAIVAPVLLFGPADGPAGPFADAGDAALVARGQRIYAGHCASCHGAHREGQPDWHLADARGRVRAPPHDETGHTWQHSDEEIFRMIKRGRSDAAPEGYISDMPAFADRLSDHDILATMAFIKAGWPAGVQAAQAMLNRGAGLPSAVAAVGVDDWRLPPDCTPGLPPAGAAPH